MEQSPFGSRYDDEHLEDDAKDAKKAKNKKRSTLESASKAKDKKHESSEANDESVAPRGRRLDLSSLLDASKTTDKSEADTVQSEEAPSDAAAERDPEGLSEDELQLVAQQLIEDHSRQLEDELASTEPSSADEAEALSSAYYIDQLAEQVRRGEPVDDELLDAVADEVIRDLGLEAPESVDADESLIDEGAEAVPDDTDEDLSPPFDPVVPVPPPAPPMPTGPPPAPPSPPPPSPPRFGGGTPPTGPATPPPRSSASVLSPPLTPPTRAEAAGRGRRRGTDLLVGGIVGYLIGRRRGRIKTEARLLPIQKSLEKQVRDLDEKISIRERTIRVMAADKVAREGEAMRRKLAEKTEAKVRNKAEAQRQRREANHHEQSAPGQVNILDSEPQRVVQHEQAPSTSRLEKLASAIISQTEVRPAVTKEAVGRMSDTELMKLAAAIEVDGQSAKQLYEQGRLGKDDVRAVVTEQLIGQGRAERLLRERRRSAEADSGTLERLSYQSTPQPTVQLGGADSSTAGSGSDAVPAAATPAVDVSAASDALIAQHAAREHTGSNPYTYIWLVLGIIAVLFILGLLLL